MVKATNSFGQKLVGCFEKQNKNKTPKVNFLAALKRGWLVLIKGGWLVAIKQCFDFKTPIMENEIFNLKCVRQGNATITDQPTAL